MESIKPESFYEMLFKFVGDREGFSEVVYDDGKGIPTIGFGTALVIKGTEKRDVLTGFEKRLREAGVQLDSSLYQADHKKLLEIAEALDAGNRTKASDLIKNHKFSIKLDKPQARKLYNIGMERDHLSIVKNKLDGADRRSKKKPRTYEQLAGTRELIALADISYSGPKRLTDELIGYVVAGERQKVFYHMAYKMRSGENLDKYKGYVTRSYNEAYMYGYTAGLKPTEADVRAMEEIYKANKEEIDAYDRKWGGKLTRDIPGWVPFAELIRLARQGNVVAWTPPNPRSKGTVKPGVSAEQIALMTEHLIPGARPQPLGVSAYEKIMMMYSGGGSDAPLKHVHDPFETIRRRYGGN